MVIVQVSVFVALWLVFQYMIGSTEQSSLTMATVVSTALSAPLSAWASETAKSTKKAARSRSQPKRPQIPTMRWHDPIRQLLTWSVMIAMAAAQGFLLHRVFALVVYDLAEWAVWAGVAGLAVTTFTLAWQVGARSRNRTLYGLSWRSDLWVWLAVSAWILVGVAISIIGVYFAWAAPGDRSVFYAAAGTTVPTVRRSSIWPVIEFAAVFVGAGGATTLCSYLLHNHHVAYRRAIQQREAAERELGRLEQIDPNLWGSKRGNGHDHV
jgi:hypothetical protein